MVEYFSPYSATIEARPIMRQGSQALPDKRSNGPSVDLRITPAKTPPAATQADGLGSFQCVDETLSCVEQYSLLSTDDRPDKAQSHTALASEHKAIVTGNIVVPFGPEVVPAERGSLDYPIIVLDNDHKSSNGGECQERDDFRSLRRQPAHFRYPPGYFEPGLWDVEEDAKENTRDIGSTASSKISCDQDSVDEFVHRGCEREHRQFRSMAPGPSKPEYLDIDSFESDTTWEARPTDSREQPYVGEFTASQPLGEVRAITAHAELKGQDILRGEILDNKADFGGNDDLSHCFTSAAGIAADSTAQRSGTMMMPASGRQDSESPAGLDADNDAATLVNVEPSDRAEGVPAPESFHVAELQSIITSERDDQEHEINDIIGKEEVNDEAYYWVDWTPTLVPLSALGKASDLVGKFEGGLQTQRSHAKGRRQQMRSGPGRGRQAITKALPTPQKPPCLLRLLAATKQAQRGIPAEIQKPKRGRPRKQT